MIPVWSAELMRKSDERTTERIPAVELMGRAAERIFEAVLAAIGQEFGGPAAVVCGSGNNGGDGYALALLFRDAGIPVTLFPLSPPKSNTAAHYAGLCESAGIPAVPWGAGQDLSSYALIADCIFGTGFSGALKPPASDAIREINRCGRSREGSGAFVVSADINSGLNAESGMAAPVEGTGERLCVRSDLTVSVGAFQPGHFLGMAKDLIRRKLSADIGIECLPGGRPFGLVEAEDAALAFPPRLNFSNKSDYGYIALIGGSDRYSGAVRLASLACAAMRSGAGVVKTAAPASLCPLIAPSILEATLFPLPDRDGKLIFDAAAPDALEELTRGLRSVAFGMGAGLSPDTEKIVSWLLEHCPDTQTLLLDADGLNALSRLEDGSDRLKRASDRGAKIVLTPHTMEFSRLLHLPRETGVSEILENPIPLAESFAREHGVTLLLKGPTTVVTDGARTLLIDRGCPGMATAGSGDVLSGILAAVSGWVRDPLEAAASAAWVNGRAGELAQEEIGDVSMTAGDTVRHIPAAIRELTGR